MIFNTKHKIKSLFNMDLIRKKVGDNIFGIIDEYASTIILIKNNSCGIGFEYLPSEPALLVYLDLINSKCVKRIKKSCYKIYKHIKIREQNKLHGDYILVYIGNSIKNLYKVVYNIKHQYILYINEDEMLNYVYKGGPLEIHSDVVKAIDHLKLKKYMIIIIPNRKNIYIWNPIGAHYNPEQRWIYGESLAVTDYNNDSFIIPHNPSKSL